MAAVAPPHQQQYHQRPSSAAAAPLPLFDLFLDLPHPAAAKQCPPPYILGAPSTTPEMEQELNSNLSRIGRFAFPEFEDAAVQNLPPNSDLNRFSQYAMQPKTFQHYTFSLQLQSGVRIHGHVRRYLAAHPVAKTRYDVGRRGERALVLLTRANGGDLVYSAILKTLDAISFQKTSLDAELHPHGEQPDRWFLHKLFEQHRHLCNAFASLPQQGKKPMVLTVNSLEVGPKPIPLIDQVDNSKFLIPTSLLSPASSTVETLSSSSILPLLRVLGVQSTLRLLSALISESRILLVSISPTRLAQCARSALSILAQGLLNWQHLYIPVLPPHLFQYLAAPVPYLIGMLAPMLPRLDRARADGLGEMVIINLDTVQMETRGINPADVAKKIPDLFRANLQEQGMPASSMSAAELLAQDLLDLLKVDKRSLYGESTLTNVSETAAKASKAVKSGLLKLKEKGKRFLQSRSGSSLGAEEFEASVEAANATGNGGGPETVGTGDQDTLLPDYIYTQGAQNEVTEEEARVAFASFFLSLFGNMRWYLSVTPGQAPQLDRKRFLQQKRAMGDGENSALWPLLENFCQTQMLEEFAKARVHEIHSRQPVTSDSPLFMQCANYHQMHNIDFSVMNVRRVARQVAQNDPSRVILQTQARRTAMLLTSNRTYEGDYNRAVAALVEQCRECSSVLFDVMSVIWVRLRDSKGLHWKHGFQALQILRNLLYHGPLSSIAEATDGLDKIRAMKFYNDNMRSQICTQIRQVANQVYNMLVDRAKLYAIRRLCINKRRVLYKPDQTPLVRDTRMRVMTPFSAMHKAFNPGFAKVAPAPGPPSQANFAGEQSLLDFASPPPPAAPTSTPFGYGGSTSQLPPLAPAPSSAAQDIASLFATNVTISSDAPSVASTATNPFDAPGFAAPAPTPVAADPFAVPPVVVSPPPVQQPPLQLQAPPAGQHGQYPSQNQPPQQHQQPSAMIPAQPQGQVPAGQAPPYPMPGQNFAYPPYQQPNYPPAGQAPPANGAHGYAPQPAPGQQFYQPQGPPQPIPQYQQTPNYPPAEPKKPNVSQFDPFK